MGANRTGAFNRATAWDAHLTGERSQARQVTPDHRNRVTPQGWAGSRPKMGGPAATGDALSESRVGYAP